MFRLIKDDVPQDAEDENDVFVPHQTHVMNRIIGGALCVACGIEVGEHGSSGREVLSLPCTNQTRVVPPPHHDSHIVISTVWDGPDPVYAYICERCGVTDRDAVTRRMLQQRCIGRTSNPLARARVRQHSMNAVEREARRAETDEAARIAQRARRAVMKENIKKAVQPIKRIYDLARKSEAFWFFFNVKGIIVIYLLVTTILTPPVSPAALAIAENIRNHPEEWVSYNGGSPFKNKKRGIIVRGEAANFLTVYMNGTPVESLGKPAFLYGRPSQRVVRREVKQWHDDRVKEANAALLASLR